MLKQHLLLCIKHIDLTRLGTDSGAADDGKRAFSVAWSCSSGREALGEGVWGRGEAGNLGRVTDAVDSGVGLGHVGLMLPSWALLGALLGIFDTFLNAFEFFLCLLVDLGWDF